MMIYNSVSIRFLDREKEVKITYLARGHKQSFKFDHLATAADWNQFYNNVLADQRSDLQIGSTTFLRYYSGSLLFETTFMGIVHCVCKPFKDCATFFKRFVCDMLTPDQPF